MRTLLTCLALLAAPLAAHAQTVPTPDVPTIPEIPVVGEAKVFMAAYAADLLAGNREALIARYDRRGAWFPGDPKPYYRFDQIGALYRGEGWTKPKSFKWEGLSYEPIGMDAVAVTGSFLWNGTRLSYTGLLIRQDKVLRIRIEHEAPMAP